jgi:putative peptidoglycan lipid II flippase
VLAPLVLASAANYVNVAVERAMAARLPEGSLAALTYAFRLLNFPVNLFLLNATTMLFTPLARHAARDERDEVSRLTQSALRLAFVYTAPLAALAAALSTPAVRVLLERGAFTLESTALTATAVTLYAPAIVGMAGVHVLTRTYQALQEIPRLALTGVAVIAINIPVLVTLTTTLGFVGLPVATSINWLLLVAVMLLVLRRRLPGLDVRAAAASAARALLAGVVAAVVAAVVSGHAAGPVGEIVLGAAGGVMAYGAVLRLLSRDDAMAACAFLLPIRAARFSASR